MKGSECFLWKMELSRRNNKIVGNNKKFKGLSLPNEM